MPPLNIHAHNLGIVCLAFCKVQRLSTSTQKLEHTLILSGPCAFVRGLSVRLCDQGSNITQSRRRASAVITSTSTSAVYAVSRFTNLTNKRMACAERFPYTMPRFNIIYIHSKDILHLLPICVLNIGNN